jgi:4-amino-4-deoxy-L-arabinose transferase-like glycosyltransferase
LVPLLVLAVAISGLYLFKLNGVGVLGPDEPRYAAIGRSMAESGDFVTPHLWGTPWFEKPPLLYWMTAVATAGGLGPDLSGRLPVALLSLLFLAASYMLLKREFGAGAALFSTVLLATSAGWITFSGLCLTDLPLAVFFSLAVFLSLPLLRAGPQYLSVNARLVGMGACLGFAMLAKGLVPLALALPLAWFLRRFWPKWWMGIAAMVVVAAPWYIAVYARNGYPFIQDFFLKQHFERLYSPLLQHLQPWYYYFPVLLAGVFPWTPMLAFPFLREAKWDSRRRCLAAVFVFGFVLFSCSRNKLPGYLLPLLPSLFALIGARFEERPVSRLSRWWFLGCAAFAACIPLLANVLPGSLSRGRISLPAITAPSGVEWFYIALPVVAVLLVRKAWTAIALALCIVASGIYLKIVAFPVLDQEVSPRGLWRTLEPYSARLCDGGVDRDWLFGLTFYRGSVIPPCHQKPWELRLRTEGRGRPIIKR